MTPLFTRGEIALAACALLGAAALAPHAPAAAADKAKDKAAGTYVTGDFHNHTTCSDGTLSMKKLIAKSVGTWNLDWFVQADHGGSSARNCTLAEDPIEPVAPALGLTTSDTGPWPPATFPKGGQPAASGKGPNQTWEATIGNAAIKGNDQTTTNATTGVTTTNSPKAMWRWQEIKEFQYPVAEAEGRARQKPVWIGVEQNAPGHEHISTTVLKGQLPWPSTGTGDASLQAQYEYCFDRSDADTSRGAENQWDCSVPGSSSNSLMDATAAKIKGTNSSATPDLGHTKTLEGIKWMVAKAPTSYFVPAHLERPGPYNPTSNAGYNIEHLRDFNNAGPQIAFGFESMPGHQAAANRGEYGPTVIGGVSGGFPNSVGGGTYGGTGIYAAQVGGVWDALLGEGRNWWFFASSDYHNRGSFGPDQRESNQDFQPGEYQKTHVMVRKGANQLKAEGIIDGLRSGNAFAASGDLVDRLAFVVCTRNPAVPSSAFKALVEKAATNAVAKGGEVRIDGCATMGEKLVVRPGAELMVGIAVRDPQGTNNSPYAFANPSLKQVNITQPLNAPVLDHIDLIGGNVTGYIAPTDAKYKGTVVPNISTGLLTPNNNTGGARNDSTKIQKVFNASNWTALADGVRVMSYKVSNVTASQYFRLRGSNLPPATPNETDADGNPILDFKVSPNDQSVAGTVPCTDAACPSHLRTVGGAKYSSFDVAAWADLWFYSNPVFVQVNGGTTVAGAR
ncbi:MAG TPA: hypothetical protein VGF26_00245 [Ramlibacter sp.]